MGVDLLDITFRLERAFDLRIALGDMFPEERFRPRRGEPPPPEPIVWDVYLYVRRRYAERYGDDLDGERVCDRDRPCAKCGYNLRGLPFRGSCPECGELASIAPLSDDWPQLTVLERDAIWRGVRRALRQALLVEREEIKPWARLFSDLGAA